MPRMIALNSGVCRPAILYFGHSLLKMIQDYVIHWFFVGTVCYPHDPSSKSELLHHREIDVMSLKHLGLFINYVTRDAATLRPKFKPSTLPSLLLRPGPFRTHSIFFGFCRVTLFFGHFQCILARVTLYFVPYRTASRSCFSRVYPLSRVKQFMSEPLLRAHKLWHTRNFSALHSWCSQHAHSWWNASLFSGPRAYY